MYPVPALSAGFLATGRCSASAVLHASEFGSLIHFAPAMPTGVLDGKRCDAGAALRACNHGPLMFPAFALPTGVFAGGCCGAGAIHGVVGRAHAAQRSSVERRRGVGL